MVQSLEAPIDAFRRIDVTPRTVTELHSHDGQRTAMRTNSAIAR